MRAKLGNPSSSGAVGVGEASQAHNYGHFSGFPWPFWGNRCVFFRSQEPRVAEFFAPAEPISSKSSRFSEGLFPRWSGDATAFFFRITRWSLMLRHSPDAPMQRCLALFVL